MPFSPCEINIKMRLVETNSVSYYIGNCDMDLNLKDTVITLIEPEDNRRETVLIIKRVDGNRKKFPNHNPNHKSGQHNESNDGNDDTE